MSGSALGIGFATVNKIMALMKCSWKRVMNLERKREWRNFRGKIKRDKKRVLWKY